ncbi:MAG: T9SS type A sorting domain-containing protein [Ignavibacteriae bacterium]|nr:T9SS type A sorting domain-containing protein [Ignavibacteriota bacterium]
MKKSYFIFIILFFLNTAISQTGWIVQDVSPNFDKIVSFSFIQNSTGYAVTDGNKLFKTTNSGINWIIVCNLIMPAQPSSVVFTNNQTGYVCGNNNFIYKTTNGGTNWIGYYSDCYHGYFHSITFFGNTGWAVGTGYGAKSPDTSFVTQGLVCRTTNGGLNWSKSYTLSEAEYYSVYFTDSLTGYAAGYILYSNYESVISKTINGGGTFFSPLIGNFPYLFGIFFVNNNTGWAVGGGGIILKSTNGAASWVSQNSSINSDLNAVYFINAQTGWACGYGGKIVYTSNGGANWIQQTSPVIENLYCIKFTSDSIGFIGANNGKILRTTNGGITTFSENNSTSLTDRFYLFQNYPNPFNPSTNIKYQITNSKFVTLKVFDLLGKEVATFVNQKQSSGSYEVNFDARTLSSGIYFYTLYADGIKIETKKMILLK